ncbi:MAG: family 16 glycoside hydrolase [Gemmatimonadota bacterium]
MNAAFPPASPTPARTDRVDSSGPALPAFAAALALIALAAAPVTGQEVRLDLDDPAWSFDREAEVRDVDGAPALVLRSGVALREDIDFRDGTIEFEMRPTDRRAFLGVVFRTQENGDGEDVYLRLHKTGLADATQYTPDYGGRGQWQIYHGPDATAPARFAAREWQRVRIEVRGSQAALFVGDAEEPQLVADRLRAGVERGFIAFWGNHPGATGDDPPTAAVRDIVIRHGETSYAFEPPAVEKELPGIIGRWALSGTFARSGDDVLELPDPVPSGWRAVGVAENGVLELDRHAGRVQGGISAVLAGVRIRSADARTVRLRLGFSDDASVFLNGRLIATMRNAFSTNFPRRQGLLLQEQAAVYLPLDAGDNTLVIAVGEIFGGWGLYGRIADREGLEITPLE